jgi:hypothetical protein
MLELLKDGKHGFPQDKPLPLSESDLKDLAEFVLSL